MSIVWLLLAPVELLNLNQNETSDIPVTAVLCQDELQCWFWSLSWVFFQGSSFFLQFLFSPTDCHTAEHSGRFIKPTLSLPQQMFGFFLSLSSAVFLCHYASVTKVSPDETLHASPSDSRWWFLVTVRLSLRDLQLQVSCIRFVVA